MEEIWIDIPEYEHYQFSNLGNCKSRSRIVRNSWNGSLRVTKEKILKRGIDPNGYYFHSVRKNNRMVRLFEHQLIAKLYIPNSDNKPFVCHKNDIKTDNRVENLYWGDRSSNANDAHRNKVKQR